MFTRLHHVGLVVRRIEDGLALWRDVLGLDISAQATVEDQGVKAALLPIGRSEIELLEPVNANGGVAKFLEKRGEGLHHLCLETPDVAADLAAARAAGFPLIDETPRQGLAGTICFLHPKGTAGVLTEFATPPPGAHPHGACGRGVLRGVALSEVTARSRDPQAAAALFHTKLGLATDGPGTAVSVGGVRVTFVADPQAPEGISGLVLEVPDPFAAEAPLGALGATRAGTDLVLDPARCHGVPLRVTRAR